MYFEKGFRKKCMRQSRKVLRVDLSSMFFKEIWNNGTRGHGLLFSNAKGNKKRLDSYSDWNSLLIISHITFWECRMHIFLATTFLEITVYQMVAALTSSIVWLHGTFCVSRQHLSATGLPSMIMEHYHLFYSWVDVACLFSVFFISIHDVYSRWITGDFSVMPTKKNSHNTGFNKRLYNSAVSKKLRYVFRETFTVFVGHIIFKYD